MIRGTLILLLSFVVLSLQECTCKQNAGDSVQAKSIQLYSISTDAKLDLTFKPQTGADLQTGLSDFSTGNGLFAFISGKSSADIVAALDEADKKLNESSQAADNVVTNSNSFIAGKAIVDAIIADFRVDDNRWNADDCKQAFQVVVDSLYQKARDDLNARTQKWLDVNLATAPDFKSICETRRTIFQNIKNLNDKIEADLASCTVLCSRTASATKIILASPDAGVSIITAGVTGLGSAITTHIGKVTAAITANADAFFQRTAVDDKSDAIRQKIYALWERTEELDFPTWDEIKASIKSFVENADDKAAFLERIVSCLQDYTVTSPVLTCTGQDDNSGEITFTFTGVVAGAGDLTVAAGRLLKIFKSYVLAWFAALHVDCTQDSWDAATGAFTFTAKIVRVKIEVIATPIQDAAVVAGNKIDEFKATADQDVADIIAGGNDVVADVQAFLAGVDTAKTVAYTNAANAVADVNVALEDRSTAAVQYYTDQKENADSLHTSTDCLCKIAYASWNLITTKVIADGSATVDYYAKNLEEAKGEVEARTSEYLTAKVAYLSDKSDETQQSFWNNYHAAQEESIKQACITREQINQTHNDLMNVNANAQTSYATWKTELEAKYTQLESGLKADIGDVITSLSAKKTEYEGIIRKAITGLRPSCSDITFDWKNLDKAAGDSYLGCAISIVDVQQAGETLDQWRASHELCIKSTLALCAQNDGFVVEYQASTTKRQSGSSSYVATLGTSPGTDAPSSNANTVVYSFAVFSACLLLALF